MTNNTALKQTIIRRIQDFADQPLRKAALALFADLGYRSDRTVETRSVQNFCEQFDPENKISNSSALIGQWQSAELLFQLTDEELSSHTALFKDEAVHTSILQSYVFIAIDLRAGDYARGKLAGITRQINRIFPMPVMVLFKIGEQLSLAVINRRINRRDENKDVLGKVTLIQNIAIAKPHPGHLDILTSFSMAELSSGKRCIENFDQLHAAWEEIFNVELLNKRFYRELANWYFWALPQVDFPSDIEKDDEKRRATGLIRLLTRLIFCWFLKEKRLIPDALFNEASLKKILKDLSPDVSTYHEAVLQNLFFATLNQRMGKDTKGRPFRAFAKDEGFAKNRSTYGVDTLYRYEEHFCEPASALDHFADVPFLNGGLFECLDRFEDGTNKKLYLDGFSRNKNKRPVIPNYLFFDTEHEVDLSGAYGDNKRKKEKVRGLLHILHAYKFTIVENTPVDQEIALDPELLGKVFENLLASYNEETKTTARKQTGSFYTPRPIVEYMVDESLKAYLTGELTKVGMSEQDAKTGLDILFAYTEQPHPFSEQEVITLLDAIHSCKILDPACGSGAFPMGMLHKLVYIIHKLDPNNARWKQIQIDAASNIPDLSARDTAIAAIERDFSDNEDDYGRKLYLIENCLYGVDIQPIAIQISKLRFFISLICDQRTNRNKRENHGIRPLPNLETKFVAANTLIGLPNMDQLALVPYRVHQIEAEIEVLYHSHFSIQRRDQKIALQKKIKILRNELGRLLAESLGSSKKAQYIADWDPFDPQATSDFFDPYWMFGRSLANGFDVIIGNPPYIGESGHKELFRRTKEGFLGEFYMGKMDYFYFFFHVALKYAKLNGCIAFITTNYFMTASGAKKLRSEIKKVSTVEKLVNFNELKIFEAALGQHNLISILSKRKSSIRAKTCETKRIGMADSEILRVILEWKDKDTNYFEVAQSDLFDGENNYIRLSYQSLKSIESGFPISAILDIVASSGKKLGSIASINQGVVSGCDYVSKSNIDRLRNKSGIQIKDGIFVFDYKNPRDKEKLSRFSNKEMRLLRGFYKNSDIDRYYSASHTTKRLLYIDRSMRNIDAFPQVQHHLNRFKDILTERREVKNGVIEFFQLQWPRSENIFTGPKLVLPYRSNMCSFAYNELEWFCRSDCYVITKPISGYDLHFLMAFLNSQICYCWLYHRGKRKGRMLEVFQTPLSEIPIPKTSKKVRSTLATLARLRSQLEKKDFTSAFLEDLIDACVMECYFREHMAERNLLFIEELATYLSDYNPDASDSQRLQYLNQLSNALNAPSSKIRNRLLRITADSPDLLAVIKKECNL